MEIEQNNSKTEPEIQAFSTSAINSWERIMFTFSMVYRYVGSNSWVLLSSHWTEKNQQTIYYIAIHADISSPKAERKVKPVWFFSSNN